MNPKLLSLMKYASLKVDQLTPKIVAEIAAAMGHPVDMTDAHVAELIAVLRHDNVDKLADLLTRQDVFMAKVAPILAKGKEKDIPVILCPHCNLLIELNQEQTG